MKPCPFCAEEIQDAAIKCKHCGSMLDRNDQQQRVDTGVADAFTDQHEGTRCPKCRSGNVQKLSILYASGTSTTSGTATTVGVDSEPGIGIAKTSIDTKTQSILASSSAPPEKPEEPFEAGCMALLVIPLTWGGGQLGGPPLAWTTFILGTVIAIVLAITSKNRKKKYKEDLEAYGKNHAEWEKTYQCHRCGERFVLENNS